MQGIIIAGGKGTRLNLFTRRVNNKHLVLVYDHLAIEYPINSLVSAEIKDITLIIGERYAGEIINVLGDGREFGIENLNYVYQKGAGGIAQAIYQAKEYVKDKVAVILGDNFFSMDISENVKEFTDYSSMGCRVFVHPVDNPKRYGVAEIASLREGENLRILKILDIQEKPEEPRSNLAVTGLYFYDTSLFSRIANLAPSTRNELEVTDLNKTYIQNNLCYGYYVKGYWNDMGTYDSILEVANYVKQNNFKLNSFDAWSL